MQNLTKYLKSSIISSILILAALNGFAQNQDTYFQQKADYIINVKLNDTTHSLQGDFSLIYTNHSPDELTEIYFHLYPNAYKNPKTALAQQNEKSGMGDFIFAKKSQLGYIDSLAFQINGQDALLKPHPEHIDIAILELNSPLKSGENITIKSPFYVKIPEVFSRLGHNNQAYYITQWYPKPAVYDNQGWHAFPYLNQGEFYSEFGDYEVNIELPKNYRVAASGQLQDSVEKHWLMNLKDTESLDIPPSSDSNKTVHFKGTNIHDFAWFADKRFCVRHEINQNGKDIWAYFLPDNTKDWEKVPRYIRQTIDFYSEQIGELPYPSISAIEGLFSAGGGMEYPGVTIINHGYKGRMLENIIVHEVGHNWFYGVLGFNERRYPFLDEGLNSFYEHLYMEKFYPDLQAKDALIPFLKDSYSNAPYRVNAELTYKITQSLGIDQAANLTSNDYHVINYGSVIYKKTVAMYYYLRYSMGEEKFKQVMQSFYEKWANKHPSPENFRNHLEKESGENLSWFFDGLINTIHGVDYKICQVKDDSITIKNKGKIAAPLFLEHNGKEYKFDGFQGKQTLCIKNLKKGDRIEIDPNFKMLEANRNNNLFRRKCFNKKLKFKFGAGIDDFKSYEIFYLPIPAFNMVDGFMPGVLLYNNFLPVKNFEYRILPMYGVNSKSLTGTANFHYRHHFTSSNWLRTAGIETSAKQFSILKDLQYQKFQAGVYMDFKLKPLHKKLKFQVNIISINNDKSSPTYFQQALLSFKDISQIHPFEINLKAERGPAHYKLEFEGKTHLNYNKRKGLDIRLFAGTMDYFPGKVTYLANFRLAGNSNISDYLYDLTLFNRSVYMSDYHKLGARQFEPNQGGFTLYTPVQSKHMLSLNLNSTTPLPVLRVYANFAIIPELYKAKSFYGNKVLFDTGVELQIIKDIFEIYFPVIASQDLMEINKNLYSENYFQRIRFRLSLNLANPWDLRFKNHLFY